MFTCEYVQFAVFNKPTKIVRSIHIGWWSQTKGTSTSHWWERQSPRTIPWFYSIGLRIAINMEVASYSMAGHMSVNPLSKIPVEWWQMQKSISKTNWAASSTTVVRDYDIFFTLTQGSMFIYRYCLKRRPRSQSWCPEAPLPSSSIPSTDYM